MIKYNDRIKQSKSFDLILKDVNSNSLAHSYMIISEDKDTLYNYIKIMSQVIYCDTRTACGKCNNCIKIDSDNHTNITTLRSDDSIKVDDIKTLVNHTYMSAMQDGVKLYIIADGEKMNESSQNKLLKTLEEPSRNVVILIGTTNENSMLQTIKSRCKKIHLSVWNDNTISMELSKVSTDSELISLASKFSTGSITRAMSILSDETWRIKYNNILSVLNDFKGSANLAKFQNIFGTDKEQVVAHLNVFEGVISSLIKSISKGTDTELSGKYSIGTLANIYDIIIDAYKRINSNCNISSVVYNLLLQIAETKYKLA